MLGNHRARGGAGWRLNEKCDDLRSFVAHESNPFNLNVKETTTTYQQPNTGTFISPQTRVSLKRWLLLIGAQKAFVNLLVSSQSVRGGLILGVLQRLRCSFEHVFLFFLLIANRYRAEHM